MLTEREYDQFRLDQEERIEQMLIDTQRFVLGDRASEVEPQPQPEVPNGNVQGLA
jgi:hypothetical protein